jgi:hypothetical protein
MMLADPLPVEFTFFQVINALFDAEMVPVGPIRGLSAGSYNFLQRRDQRLGGIK